MYRLLFISIILMLIAVNLNADLVIVVNKSNTVNEISQLDIQNIYSGKKTTWDDGSPVQAAFLTSTDARDVFLKDVIRKTLPQYTNFWKKAIFTGTGNPPTELNTPEEMKKFIASNSNAIGFLSSTYVDESIKSIEIK